MADLAIRNVTYQTIGTATRPDLHVAVKGEQHTALTGEDIAAGAPVYVDPATGRFRNASAGAAATAAVYGVALRAARVGQGLTAMKRGVVEGINLDAMPYGAQIYLSNTVGRMADVAGTTAVPIGRVLPVHGHERIGGTPSKLLNISL